MAEFFDQTALSAGEISPELYGLVDLAKYKAAATTLRNMVVNYRGGAISRAGTAVVGVCLQTTAGTGPPRIIPFQFSITQGYILEFGDNYLRFVFQGGYVLDSMSAIYTIATPYAAVDLPYLKFSQSADVMSLTCSNPLTSTEYPPQTLTRIAGNNWTLVPTDFGAGIDPPASTTGTPFSSTTADTYYDYVVTAVDAVTGEESVASTSAIIQNNNISINLGTNQISWEVVLGANSYNIYSSVPSYNTPVPAGAIHGYVGNALGLTFTDTNLLPDYTKVPPVHKNPFAEGPIFEITPTAGGINYSQETVGYAITTATGSGFVGIPLIVNGSLAGFYIENEGENYRNTDTIAITDSGGGLARGNFVFTANPANTSVVVFNGQNATFKNAPTNPADIHIESTLALTLQGLANFLNSQTANLSLAAAVYTADATHLYVTYKTPGAVGNAYTLANGGGTTNATPSGATLTGGGTAGTGATATLSVGALTGTFPGVNSYFQERLFYANSFNDPDTFWASKPGSYTNFDSSIPTTATDSITASPWTEQVNGVQWLVPMPGGLITMTGNRAWQIVGEGSYNLNAQPITPSTTQAQPQAFNGCSATVPPIVIDYDVLYVEAVGNTTVRDLSWTAWTNIYTGADLTTLSAHLFLYQEIIQWAWSRKPYKVLWATRDDGTLLSLTYLKEQEVYGWARHDTNGFAVSIASITEPPVDAVYMVVQRFPPAPAPTTGIYVLERMDDRIWQSVEDAWAVDSGVSNPMPTPAATVSATSLGGGVAFVASSPIFSGADIGKVLRMCGGIAVITANPGSILLTGDWILDPAPSAIGIPYAPAGKWTLTPQITTLSAPHLAGMVVDVLADGFPVKNVIVAGDGTIAWGFEASNVKTGLAFLPQLQTPYLNGQNATQGARKIIPAATARLAASGSFQVGTNQPDGQALNPPQFGPAWANMAAADTNQATGGQKPQPQYTSPGGKTITPLFTGDLRVVGENADWNSKGQVAIQQPLPLALEVVSVEPEVLPGDMPEVAYQQKAPDAPPRPPGRWQISSGSRL